MIYKMMPATPEGAEPYQVEAEVGNATFTTTATTAALRTNLDTIVAGFVNLVNDTTIATDEKSYYSVPLGAVTSNSINISRSSHQAISGASVCVLLLGRRTSQ